ELLEARVGALPQLREGAELDRLRRAGFRARRLVAALQPVVAERALPHAAVADVLLHDDRPELRAEERAGRADVEARRVRAVLADVGLHQPAQPRGAVAVHMERLLLLDERDVSPRVRAERRRVVVRLARPYLTVLRDEVPLLARDLARLAADADRRV